MAQNRKTWVQRKWDWCQPQKRRASQALAETQRDGGPGHRRSPGMDVSRAGWGEMGGEEASQRRGEKVQPPQAFRAAWPTSQTCWAGACTHGVAPPAPRARASGRQVGGGGTGPRGGGGSPLGCCRNLPRLAPGESGVGGIGGPGRRPRLPLSAEAGAAPGPRSASRALGRGWGRSRARRKPREPRGLGPGGQTQRGRPAPTLPPPLPFPTSDAVLARVSGDRARPLRGAAAAVGLERPSPGP